MLCKSLHLKPCIVISNSTDHNGFEKDAGLLSIPTLLHKTAKVNSVNLGITNLLLPHWGLLVCVAYEHVAIRILFLAFSHCSMDNHMLQGIVVYYTSFGFEQLQSQLRLADFLFPQYFQYLNE